MTDTSPLAVQIDALPEGGAAAGLIVLTVLDPSADLAYGNPARHVVALPPLRSMPAARYGVHGVVAGVNAGDIVPVAVTGLVKVLNTGSEQWSAGDRLYAAPAQSAEEILSIPGVPSSTHVAVIKKISIDDKAQGFKDYYDASKARASDPILASAYGAAVGGNGGGSEVMYKVILSYLLWEQRVKDAYVGVAQESTAPGQAGLVLLFKE